MHGVFEAWDACIGPFVCLSFLHEWMVARGNIYATSMASFLVPLGYKIASIPLHRRAILSSFHNFHHKSRSPTSSSNVRQKPMSPLLKCAVVSEFCRQPTSHTARMPNVVESVMARPQRQPFRLLSLPAEIRNMIYSELLVEKRYIHEKECCEEGKEPKMCVHNT